MTVLTASTKSCCRCGVTKPLTDFSKNKRTPDGHKYQCKTCISSDYFANQDAEKEKRKQHYAKNKKNFLDRSYDWRKQNPLKRQFSEKKRALKKKYNLSWDDYVNMFEQHDGKCAICGVLLAMYAHENAPSACVDHCHKTGKIRGLLCYSCNLLLGHARDDVSLLDAAKEYLNASTN